MKKILFILLFIPLFCFSQTDYDQYLPTVAWTTDISNVIYVSTDTFTVDVSPLNFGDPGAFPRIMGNYLSDNSGSRYEVIDTTSYPTITVVDVFNEGHSPYSGKIGVVYKSAGEGESHSIFTGDYSQLDDKAIGYGYKLDMSILWEQLGQPFEVVQYDTTKSQPEYETGISFYDTINRTISVMLGNGVIMQVNQESLTQVYNDSGDTIKDGRIVGFNGVYNETVCVQYASKNERHTYLGTATEDILPNSKGLVVSLVGKTNNVNTGNLTTGLIYLDTLGYVSNDVGEFPDYNYPIGICLKVGESDGIIQFRSDGVKYTNSIIDFFDGSIRESFDFRTFSDGTDIYGVLSNPSGDTTLTLVFSTGWYDFIVPDTIQLTAGVAGIKQINYVYIPESTRELTVNTSGFIETIEFAKIAPVGVYDAITTQTDGAILNQNVNNHFKSDNDNGHMVHMGDKIRSFDAQWVKPGLSASLSGYPDDLYITITSGLVRQMHIQTISEMAMPTVRAYITNDPTNGEHPVDNLNYITEYSDGSSWNNQYGKLVVWVVGNKTGESSHIMVNLPKKGYSTESDAISDADGYANYSIPYDYIGKGVLVASFVVRISPAGFTYDSTTGYADLRGKYPNNTAGSGTGASGITEYTQLEGTPSSFIDQAKKIVYVAESETAVGFSDYTIDTIAYLLSKTDTITLNVEDIAGLKGGTEGYLQKSDSVGGLDNSVIYQDEDDNIYIPNSVGIGVTPHELIKLRIDHASTDASQVVVYGASITATAASTSAIPSNSYLLGLGVVANIGTDNTTDWETSTHPKVQGINSAIQTLAGSAGSVAEAACYYGTISTASDGSPITVGYICDFGFAVTNSKIDKAVGIRIEDLQAGVSHATGIFLNNEASEVPPDGHWAIYDDTGYCSQFSNNVGINTGTTEARTALEIGGDGSILATGTYGSGWVEPNLGAGARLMWSPRKAAFRVGYVDGTQWDDTNIGTFSFASGRHTIASGIFSSAFGNSTIASGIFSSAFGNSTIASGGTSFALGNLTTASGNLAFASGYYTTAAAYLNFVLGKYNVGGGSATTWVETDPLFEIGNGADESNRANALTVLKNGNLGLEVADPDEQLEITGRFHLGQTTAPGTTTDKLYNVSGGLYWNGVELTGDQDITGIATNTADIVTINNQLDVVSDSLLILNTKNGNQTDSLITLFSLDAQKSDSLILIIDSLGYYTLSTVFLDSISSHLDRIVINEGFISDLFDSLTNIYTISEVNSLLSLIYIRNDNQSDSILANSEDIAGLKGGTEGYLQKSDSVGGLSNSVINQNASGNIGVGTVDQDKKLVVSHSTNVDGITILNPSTTAAANDLRFTSYSTASANNRNVGIFHNVAAFGDFAIKTSSAIGGDARNGIFDIYFDYLGNAGFGKANPTEKVDIVGNATTSLHATSDGHLTRLDDVTWVVEDSLIDIKAEQITQNEAISLNTNKDTTGIFHTNRELLDVINEADTSYWGRMVQPATLLEALTGIENTKYMTAENVMNLINVYLPRDSKTETLTGDINGVNDTFTTSKNYVPETVELSINGQVVQRGLHYEESGVNTIIFKSTHLPQTDDYLTIKFKYYNY